MTELQRLITGIINKYHSDGDFQGWFEALYAAADGNGDLIPWASMIPHPFFTRWARANKLDGMGKRAVVVGCGLGDDAEALEKLGFEVTAFDLSESAIKWCKERFSNTSVDFHVMDLFATPPDWQQSFDFVLEINTVQSMPPDMRQRTIQAVSNLLAPDGTMMVICSGREDNQIIEGPPWPMSHKDLSHFMLNGLTQLEFEEVSDFPRRFRVIYRRN